MAQDQGIDVKGGVFRNDGAIIWSAMPALGAYVPDSVFLAGAAGAACRGIRGKRVLDIGSGTGVTTLAISKTCPREIIAVDYSPEITELMNTVLLTGDDLDAYLEQCNGRLILGNEPGGLFQTTASYLKFQRDDFQNGIFRTLGGELQILSKSALQICESDCGVVDLVVGSHYLHWPVRQMVTEFSKAGIGEAEAVKLACAQTLAPLAAVLRTGGVMALLTTDDFVMFDDEMDFDNTLGMLSWTRHPMARKAANVMAEILEQYGIEHKPPLRSNTFKMSGMAESLEVSGLQLESAQYVGTAVKCDPRWFVAAYPMRLAGYNLTPDQRVSVIEQARDKYFSSLEASDYSLIRTSLVIFILRKR